MSKDLGFGYSFGFMHEFWTILTASMTYTRSKNHTNIMVDELGVYTFRDVVVFIVVV